MDKAVERLMEIREDIEEAKKNKNYLDGQLSGKMDELKELGCSTVEEAQEKVKDLSEELEKKEREIKKEYETLVKEYDIE